MQPIHTPVICTASSFSSLSLRAEWQRRLGLDRNSHYNVREFPSHIISNYESVPRTVRRTPPTWRSRREQLRRGLNVHCRKIGRNEHLRL